MTAVAPLPELCPRVAGVAGGRLTTCGHTLPCPYHGEPVVRFLTPIDDDEAP